ncbi:MAG: hypothetical protein ACK5H1_02255 [Tenacibaculum sp.]
MNRKLLHLLFSMLFVVGYSQSPMVKASLDTSHIRIGEQFKYKITVNTKNSVIIPKLDSLKGLELIDILKTDTLNNKLIKEYVLTGFDSGAYYIPRQQIYIKNQAYLTDSLLVNVSTVAIDTTKVKKFPIKGIKGEPYVFEDFKTYLYWAILLFITVATVLYFALKRTDQSSENIVLYQLSPYQEAIQNLIKLDKKLLWQNNKIKAFYSELSHIIKNYIEREFTIPALEQTTNELVSNLDSLIKSGNLNTDKETVSKLDQLLIQSDLVKFAKSKPLAHEIESDRKITEYIINKVKPVVAQNTEVKQAEAVILVEKPKVKQPKLLFKLIIIFALLAIAALALYIVNNHFIFNSINNWL